VGSPLGFSVFLGNACGALDGQNTSHSYCDAGEHSTSGRLNLLSRKSDQVKTGGREGGEEGNISPRVTSEFPDMVYRQQFFNKRKRMTAYYLLYNTNY